MPTLISWGQANSSWNNNSFTWDEVALAEEAYGDLINEPWQQWGGKKKKKLVKNRKIVSIRKKPFKSVNVQFMILTIAGSAIITVIVLYNDRLRWSKPTKYIWCPQTKKPM